MTTSLSDPVIQSEAALLGSVILDNSQWPHTAGISVDDFSISSHRIIFGQMAAMFQDQRPVDSVTLLTQLSRINQLEAIGDAAYLAVLTERALPENLPSYVRIVRSASRDRRVARQIERLAAISASQSPNTEASLQEHTQVLQDLLSVGDFSDQWKSLFHTFDEINDVPPTQFAIEGFLQEDGITLIGGLAGHGKTLCMLAMVRALLEGGKLFHHFTVTGSRRFTWSNTSRMADCIAVLFRRRASCHLRIRDCSKQRRTRIFSSILRSVSWQETKTTRLSRNSSRTVFLPCSGPARVPSREHTIRPRVLAKRTS